MDFEAFRNVANTYSTQNYARVTIGEDDQLSVQQKVSVGDKFGRAFRVSGSKESVQANNKIRHDLAMSLGSALGISTKDYGALLQTLQKTLGKNVFNADYFKESGLKSGRPLSSRRITQIVNAMDTANAQRAEEVSDILSGIGADSIRGADDYDIEGMADDALYDLNRATKNAEIVKGLLDEAEKPSAEKAEIAKGMPDKVENPSASQSEKSVEMVQMSEKDGAAPEQDAPVISEELQERLDKCIDNLLAKGKVGRNAEKQLKKEIDGMSDAQKERLRKNMDEWVESASKKWEDLKDHLRSVRLSPETSALLMKKLAAKPMPNLLNHFGGARERITVDDIGRDNKAWYERNGYTVEKSDVYSPYLFGEKKMVKLKAPQELRIKWVKDKAGNEVETHKLKASKLKGYKRLGILQGDYIGGGFKTLAEKDYLKVEATAIPLPNGADVPALSFGDVLDMIKTLEDAIDETKPEVDDETKQGLDKLKEQLDSLRDDLADKQEHGKSLSDCSTEVRMDIGRIYATLQTAGCQPAEQV